jgi:hypothetical protein
MNENLLSDFGKDGKTEIASAMNKYFHHFGDMATNLVTSYQNVDFDDMPVKM